MAFKVGAKLVGLEVTTIMKMIDDGAIEAAERLTAKGMARVARNNFRRLTKGSGTGRLLSDIKARKSNFKDGGWLYGVLGGVNPAGGSSAWEKSTGGRAHFFEYGRSAKGKGKSHGGPQSIKTRPQAPRPFMRQTIATGQKQLEAVASKEVKKIIKRINSGKISTKVLKEIRAK